MKIKGIETLSPDQLRHEIERGGRFVIFQYCISIVVLTFKRHLQEGLRHPVHQGG